MWKSVLKVAAAAAVFAVVHSVLASRPAKHFAAQALGRRNRDGLYRPFFIGQSLVTFGVLVVYVRRQPSVEIYRVRGPLALAMHAGQLLALLTLAVAARQVGWFRIAGVENLLAWKQGAVEGPEPEAQGPALDEFGLSRPAGPFAWTRHPLNLAFVPVFWLMPRMTTTLLAFNAVATVYLFVGSFHEEARLRAAYGSRYAAYQRSGVPFFLPSIRPRRPLRLAASAGSRDEPADRSIPAAGRASNSAEQR